jgi:methionyl aminopeptidase
VTATAAAVEIKAPREIETMREAGAIVAEVLRILSDAAKPGVSTAELDRIAETEIRRRKAKPAFLNYRGFPATLCASINDEVVHGIPRPDRVLAEGDLASLDLGCVLKSYYADAAVTVPVGKASPEALALIRTTRECLERAIAVMHPGRRIGDISAAVQEHAEAKGYGVVREFVGHGIGRALHEAPSVPNFGRAGTGMRLVEGMVLAVEPMVNLGGAGVRVLADHWTAVTLDGALSAHFEHSIAITSEGPRVLTATA